MSMRMMSVPTEKVPELITSLQGPPSVLETHIVSQQVKIEAWFRQAWEVTPPLFYASVDLRHAGFKIAPVDTNLFPAGFNNLHHACLPLCSEAMKMTIAETFPQQAIRRIVLVPENHTRNTFYFHSLSILFNLLADAGFDVCIGSVDPELTTARCVKVNATKSELIIQPLQRTENRIHIGGFEPEMILLNNDLASGVPALLENIVQPMLPPPQLGWATRLKSTHFRLYQTVCEELAAIINLDPWLLMPLCDQCDQIDFLHKEGMDALVAKATQLLAAIKQKYQQHNINKTPYLVIKADAGTYGMSVMSIRDPAELLTLNRKQRTHMSAAKGGRAVSQVILQEGVHTIDRIGSEQAIAEPVIYGIGRHVVGNFYRIHAKRGEEESLNSPGMTFLPMEFAENQPQQNRFYLYSVIGRLAMLAAAREAAEAQ